MKSRKYLKIFPKSNRIFTSPILTYIPKYSELQSIDPTQPKNRPNPIPPHKQRKQHVLAWLKMQFMWHGGKKRQLEHAIWTCEHFSGCTAASYNQCKCGKIFSDRPHERMKYLKIILAAPNILQFRRNILEMQDPNSKIKKEESLRKKRKQTISFGEEMFACSIVCLLSKQRRFKANLSFYLTPPSPPPGLC